LEDHSNPADCLYDSYLFFKKLVPFEGIKTKKDFEIYFYVYFQKRNEERLSVCEEKEVDGHLEINGDDKGEQHLR